MYFLSKFCFVCYTKSNVLDLSEQDSDGISHVYKLTSSLVGMDFEAIYDTSFICGECCTTLNTVYNFQQKCLRSKTNLLTYVSQLQTFSRVRGTLSVRLTDILQEMEAEKQNVQNQATFIYLKREDLPSRPVTDCVSVDHIKKEYDSDENNYTIQNCMENIDYFNENSTNNISSNKENGQSDIEQNSANRNVIRDRSNLDEDFIENRHVECKNEIDIEENELCKVKDEPMSDLETPSYGSSQENKNDTENEEEPLREVKEEPMSDMEAPPDGSSQGYEAAADLQGTTDHAGVSVYECRKCKERFATVAALATHVHTHTGGTRLYRGEEGQNICNVKVSHTTHRQTHSAKGKNECYICKKSFSSKSNLLRHVREHTGEKPYECAICNKKFNQKNTLNNHMLIHTGNKHYECVICSKKFNEKNTVTDHMRLHIGENPYTDVDKATENSGVEVNNQYVSESTDEFKNIYIMNRNHTRLENSHNAGRPFECEICNKRFVKNEHLTNHMQKHTDEKLYKCEICDKNYIQKQQLLIHMRIHTGERPYECNVCQKRFYRNDHVTKHMRSHTGEKPYKCEVCKKTFTTKTILSRHIRIHTGDKPFECEICHKKFIQKMHLIDHVRGHAGEKPHECEICQKKFTQKTHLQVHMRVHTGEKPYGCDVCKKRFPYKSSLKHHIATHLKSLDISVLNK